MYGPDFESTRRLTGYGMAFHTSFFYTDRETKAQYVWRKYEPILRARRILDVGADKCFLKQWLDDKASYFGIGLEGDLDQIVNLETDKIPFDDNSFDTVLCLDVLEHIENIHEIFDDLCRVTRQYVIIALPNPWGGFYEMLRHGDYRPGLATKFYGLPIERPNDRHKWFFSPTEAEQFVSYRAKKDDMTIVQLDYSSYSPESLSPKLALLKPRYQLRRLARRFLFYKGFDFKNIYAGTLWVVLAKQNSMPQ